MNFPVNLVEPDWLADHLDDPKVVVVDCRFSLADPELGRKQYDSGHIPGAYHLDLNQDMSSPVQAHGGRHPLPDWDKFIATLEKIGVSSEPPTLVVAYDDSRFAFASRLWWLLKYLGHDAVAVLNGGWGGWQAKYPVTTDMPAPGTGEFTAQPRTDWTVDIDYVRQQKDQDNVVVIDSRSPERYRGETEPIDPVAGSIPGAENAFWQAVSDEQGNMRSPAELAAHWADLNAAEEVIVYCGSGVTACVNLLSQVVAGQPIHRLYVGGWSDWCSYLGRSEE
ncbi:sulfurtransferase [filamentous cyanobacterium CCP5]|nr:sulfurtransferase [filamentous cyanobacterium CCP5]